MEAAATLFQAIAKTRHAGWYRDSCAGACPHKGARSCAFLSIWSEKQDAQGTPQKYLPILDCCRHGNLVDGPPLLQRGLCKLHHSQATWRSYGAKCEGESCAKYDWPTKEVAPLLYLSHTTRRQAVVLLHFGLYTEEDVQTLIANCIEVATLVTHLLHHKGTFWFFLLVFSQVD